MYCFNIKQNVLGSQTSTVGENMGYSEINQSTIAALLKKVSGHSYGEYLVRMSIGRIRGFTNQDISFDFPVTALIGPNGSGKSSVLGAAGCAYKRIKPGSFFPKSGLGDESMSGWRVDYELINKQVNPKQILKRSSNFRQAKWVRSDVLDRHLLYFGIQRTVPTGEKTSFKKLMSSTYRHKPSVDLIDAHIAKQVEHILGKEVANYRTTQYGWGETFLVGQSGSHRYSEFHFGASESSVIRMISKIESAPMNSLILIEEIENGLHPVATRRMVEYLIEVAERKSIQTIFTTHSDYALEPLPNEAIWASVRGELTQGKLSVEALRAVSGRVERKLAVFVEDEFGKAWVEAILRRTLGSDFDQVEVHGVAGDGNAVATHVHNMKNPAMRFRSLCIIDGDSEQKDNDQVGILRLPGSQPELSVFQQVATTLDKNLALLTVMCQLDPNDQTKVERIVREVGFANRDPHHIYNALGIALGFVPLPTVRGAFLNLWAQENPDFCAYLTEQVRARIAAQDQTTKPQLPPLPTLAPLLPTQKPL